MSSSSDPETTLTQHIHPPKLKKTKKKSKHAASEAKHEGNDPHWAYAPPDGAVLLDHTVDPGPFEFDAIKDDDDIELWLVRVPDTLKAKHLEGLEVDVPAEDGEAGRRRTARMGEIVRKTGSYDVWSIGRGNDDDDADEDADIAVGAEDLRGLTCLLPRRRKGGKLYIAPRKISRHVVVCARPAVATPQQIVHQNPPRPSYPKDVLKHAFVPYGARSQQTQSADVAMAVDVDEVELVEDKLMKTKESKRKKRKAEGESPKKPKRHKKDT